MALKCCSFVPLRVLLQSPQTSHPAPFQGQLAFFLSLSLQRSTGSLEWPSDTDPGRTLHWWGEWRPSMLLLRENSLRCGLIYSYSLTPQSPSFCFFSENSPLGMCWHVVMPIWSMWIFLPQFPSFMLYHRPHHFSYSAQVLFFCVYR